MMCAWSGSKMEPNPFKSNEILFKLDRFFLLQQLKAEHKHMNKLMYCLSCFLINQQNEPNPLHLRGKKKKNPHNSCLVNIPK